MDCLAIEQEGKPGKNFGEYIRASKEPNVQTSKHFRCYDVLRQQFVCRSFYLFVFFPLTANIYRSSLCKHKQNITLFAQKRNIGFRYPKQQHCRTLSVRKLLHWHSLETNLRNIRFVLENRLENCAGSNERWLPTRPKVTTTHSSSKAQKRAMFLCVVFPARISIMQCCMQQRSTCIQLVK